ncbi:MAG: AAA family ATPase, partial [Campylobacterales bacterium]|nr:AAA family ATPase [Campylobacterales bacterium]
MKLLIDFLESENVEKTEIFSHLKCNDEEALILKHMTKEYVCGNMDLLVSDVLLALFTDKKYEHLSKLNAVRNLLNSGWITISSFSGIKKVELLNLELFSNTISLSSSFLKLLENGTLEMTMPEISPYKDHLEYLKDQFMRIEIYQKISSLRENGTDFSHGLNRLQVALKNLEESILKRLEITTNEIIIEDFFKTHNLEKKEQIIFLALLKEEYSGEFE